MKKRPTPEQRRIWRATRAGKVSMREAIWRCKDVRSPVTGGHLTYEEYESRLQAQNGCCGICSRPDPHSKRDWHVDHEHVFPNGGGYFRGVLCNRCNTTLGIYEKIEAAPGAGLSIKFQAYLDAHRKLIEEQSGKWTVLSRP